MWMGASAMATNLTRAASPVPVTRDSRAARARRVRSAHRLAPGLHPASPGEGWTTLEEETMAEIRVEQKRGGAGRVLLLILLLLAVAAAAYWFFVMNGGSVSRAETPPATSRALGAPAYTAHPAPPAIAALALPATSAWRAV